MIDRFIKIVSSKAFSLDTESQLKIEMESVLVEENIPFKKEYVLDAKNRPDFFIDGFAIEVKIKGSAKSIYRQCERYCSFDEVNGLVLVTNRSMGFPETIFGKPCYVINLGKAWL